MNETESQTRLRRAKESIAAYQDAERVARNAHTQAMADTKRAREKYSELFQAEENREVARRLNDYNHCTL